MAHAHNFIDLTGRTFGRLRVVGIGSMNGKTQKWKCICACGVETEPASQKLRGGTTVSCGCHKREASSKRMRERWARSGGAVESLLTRERLQALLNFDETTGLFTVRNPRARWARGDKIGTDFDGYLTVGIDRRRYLVHRLVWLWVHGVWPSGDIDHINRNPSDNRPCNLRLATRSLNNANGKCRKDNRVGLKGVYPSPARNGRFCARISLDGVKRHLGSFATADEAHEAYLAAAKRLFGEFARAA